MSSQMMNVNKFKSGLYRNQDDYKTFIPTSINHPWEWSDTEINTLLEKASSELGSLNAFSDLIPNIDIYITMHIRTEANKKLLYKPCFYISDYFERNRTEYYDALNRVRLNNDLASWIKFFLKAVIETAQSGKGKFKAVTDYVRDVELKALSLGGRPDTVLKILHAFYDLPVLSITFPTSETI